MSEQSRKVAPPYRPFDHYWKHPDGRVYSSARQTLVPTDDKDFATWKANGGLYTPWPRDEHGAQTDDALQEVLSPYGLFLSQAAAIAAAIKAECSKRIYAKVSDAAQKNLTAFATKLVKDALVAGGPLPAESIADLALIDAIFQWISGPTGMLATSRTLVATGDRDFVADAKWPAWTPAWDAMIARF